MFVPLPQMVEKFKQLLQALWVELQGLQELSVGSTSSSRFLVGSSPKTRRGNCSPSDSTALSPLELTTSCLGDFTLHFTCSNY